MKSWRSEWPIMAGLGALGSLLVHLVCLVFFTMSTAPRKPEGVRSVVAMPWEEYAWSAVVGPLVVTFIIALFLPRGRSGRFACLISAAVAASVFWFGFGGLQLLRRDYIGKF